MSVTWLHISDFHVRGGDPYDRDVVLRTLVESVGEYRKRGRAPDLIFATGDIAHAGKLEEYEIAGKFFDKLLDAVKLPKSSLFIIPGNHDVNRDFGVGLARTLESREEADKYFNPDRPKPHLTLKMRAFLDWHNRYFPADRALPENTTCSVPLPVEVNGRKLGILLINSALFCQDDEDHDKLWVGRRCLDAAIADLKKLDAELNIALIHHPLEWLSPTEGGSILAALEESVHILLRGHLHEARIETVVSPEGQMLRCAAGAAYQSRKWPNRAFYATLDGDRLTIRPIKYEDAPRPLWTTDASVFPRDANHERSFAIPGKKLKMPAVSARRESAPLRFRSNIGSRGNSPFVGRDELIGQISRTLDDPNTERVVVLHGHAGVGKSELALEFARRNRDRYSGGTFQVDASADAVAIHLAAIGKNNLDLDFPLDLPLNDQGLQTFYSLGSEPALLIYDNVVSFERIAPWLPLAGMPCHVIMTTLSDTQSVAWPCIEVPVLSREQALELVKELAGAEIAERYGPAIVEHADGLPVQIVPEATTLAYERRRGHRPSEGLGIAREAGDSFSRAYQRLEQPARLLLQAAAIFKSQSIPLAELSQHLRDGLGWNEAEVGRALDTCLDLHLLSGTPDPSMHRLFGTFLRETAVSADDRVSLESVRAVQRKRFVELATLVDEGPADTHGAAAFISYPTTPEAWMEVIQSPSVEEGSTIGRALCEIGRFQEAQPWFERVVAENEKGDVNGRIDHAILGSCAHQVGFCLAGAGMYAEARPWFERAVTEKEKGDVQGRVDHENLATSIHEVGRCLSRTGQHTEALPWFERAVAETEKGDGYGRVDHESLGKSLHEVGDCLSSTGRYEEARPWYERAVAEAEKGDVRGRIDHESVGCSLNLVGYCLWSTGQYEEARPWYERAVAESEKGDVHGRIHHNGLGESLHMVGHCLASTGQYAEPLQWYKRALAEKEKGDVHGRIDHESLGRSLHEVGRCLSSMGQDAEALPWYERAVAEAEKGDVYGRVDHASLGKSLHKVGYCLFRAARCAEAQPWFERAVAEKEKGDVHGRIDQTSLSSSLELVAVCYSKMGQAEKALGWSGRAFGAKQVAASERYSIWERWLAGLDDEGEPPVSAAGVFPRIEVARAQLRQIRAFEETEVIELADDSMVLVGDNAAGKTTLLRCIALAALGPTLANQVERRSPGYLRHGAAQGLIEVAFRLYADEDPDRVSGEFVVGLEVREGETGFGAMRPMDMRLAVHNSALRLDILRRRANYGFGFICAYGALRTFSSFTSAPAYDAFERVAPLFDPHFPVADPDLLSKLLAGDVSSLQSLSAEGLTESTRVQMREKACQLLAGNGELEGSCADIRLLGDVVPLRDLSDGYASSLAMIGHLFHHSLSAGGSGGDPGNPGGIILVDEIEAHLHPSWQRRVIADIRRVLPRLQIIATTHSPIIAGSIDSSRIRLLRRSERGVHVISDLPSIAGWRADQILTSVLFDLPTSRNQQTEGLLRQYADRLAEFGPNDLEVRKLGQEVASAMQIEGEGRVDETTHELLERFLLDQFRGLDEETRRIVLAKAGLVLAR